MGDIEEEFEVTASGASEYYPQQCSALRKNGHVLIKNKPCKIVEMSTSKTGKHGHAKVHMVGIDVFTGKKYEDICPSTHNMNVPNISRNEMPLVGLSDDGFMTLMMDDGQCREDIPIPDGDVGEDIKTKYEQSQVSDQGVLVTILKAMGTECALSVRFDNKS